MLLKSETFGWHKAH